MVIQYIESAWNTYKKNFWTIAGANLLLIAIVAAIILASLVPLVSAGAGSIDANGKFVPGPNFAGALILFGLGVSLAAIAATVLRTGLVGIYAILLSNKKSDVCKMFTVARQKFWTSLGSALIVTAIVGAAVLVLVFPTVALFSNLVVKSIFLTIELIALVLFALLFSLRSQAIVIGNMKAVDSVKASFNTVKGNYLEFLALTIIFVAVSILLSFNSALAILNILVVQPIMEISYTYFYTRKAVPAKNSIRKAAMAPAAKKKAKKAR